jgi:hypothetical protein
MPTFFAKLAGVDIPSLVPKAAEDWEGGEFTTKSPAKGGASAAALNGNSIYIWVNQEDGGQGLTAKGIVSAARQSDGKVTFTLDHVELLGPPYIGFKPTPKGHSADESRLLIRGSKEIPARPGFWLQRHKDRRNTTRALDETELVELTAVLNEPLLGPSLDAFSDIEHARDQLRKLRQTTRDAVIQARIGQGQFRTDLVLYWNGCAILGQMQSAFLRASHIKPWRDCSNEERLDVFNGLLLTPNLDHLFDTGFLSFEGRKLIVSPQLEGKIAGLLGVVAASELCKLDDRHEKYFEWHRSRVFRAR